VRGGADRVPDAFDPRTGSWYGLVVYHCCRRVWSACGGQQLRPIIPRGLQIDTLILKRSLLWRETEPYLAVEYLDGDTAELVEFVGAELPFGRARDGNVNAWVLRAEQARVITAGDRALILGGVRAAREKFHLAHGVVV
jgi:hypothetical protein